MGAMYMSKETLEQDIVRAIQIAKEFCKNEEWNAWADQWVANKDRSDATAETCCYYSDTVYNEVDALAGNILSAAVFYGQIQSCELQATHYLKMALSHVQKIRQDRDLKPIDVNDFLLTPERLQDYLRVLTRSRKNYANNPQIHYELVIVNQDLKCLSGWKKGDYAIARMEENSPSCTLEYPMTPKEIEAHKESVKDKWPNSALDTYRCIVGVPVSQVTVCDLNITCEIRKQ